LAIGWLTLVAAAAVGQSRTRSTIDVSEITRGMRGYGLTVFQGTQPERFEVEVIDVLHNFRPDMDLILVRTEHPILEHARTVAGMSGSPIYLDDRLAGAYAYGWPFGLDPVAGVTPIASMFAEMRRPVRPDSFPGADRLTPLPRRQSQAPRRGPPPARLAGLSPYLGDAPRGAFAPLEEHARRHRTPANSGPRGMVAAATPVMLGGMSDRVANLLAERLEPFGLVALQAGGSSTAPSSGTPPRFVNGGAIAVQLIRGDMSATPIGTVTHVGAQRTVAFGHPMMNAGEVGLPTGTARVLHILASESRSFKLAEGGEPLGTLIQDRQPAIVIDTNLQAETIPVRIRIGGVPGAPKTEWNVEVAAHRVLTPVLVFSAIANALETTASDQTDVMYTARSLVEIDGHAPITMEDVGYMAAGPNDPGTISRLRLFDLMEVAYGNPFVETRVRRVEVNIDVRFERDVYEIVDASIPADEVDPGSRVNVHIRLRRRGEPDRVRIFPVEVPDRLAGETVALSIMSASRVNLEQPQPRNIDDLVRIVERRLPSTSLAISLKLPSRGLTFAGHVVRGLPASALDNLSMVNDTENSRPFVTYDRQLHDMGSVLYGSASLTLRVRETPRRR
jgi:hypothetical protein